MARDPWDRRDDETDAEYARFRVYLNAGPCRTLNSAYHHYTKQFPNATSGDKRRAPGYWRENSVKHSWGDRATAWDVRNLKASGNRAVVLYYALIEVMARKALVVARKSGIGPLSDEWPQLVSTLRAIAQKLPGEGLEEAAEEFIKVVELAAESTTSPPTS